MQTAVTAFTKTGIYPFKNDAFPEYLFEPSRTTDREIVDSTFMNLPQVEHSLAGPSSLEHHQSAVTTSAVSPNSGNPILTDPTSTNCQVIFRVSPSDILKLPHASRSTGTKPSRSGKTAVLTSSPYKTELLAIHKGKTTGKKIGKEQKEQNPKKKKLTATKRKLFPVKEVSESSSENEETDAACLYCNDLYSNLHQMKVGYSVLCVKTGLTNSAAELMKVMIYLCVTFVIKNLLFE